MDTAAGSPMRRHNKGANGTVEIAEQIFSLLKELHGRLPDGCAVLRAGSTAQARVFDLIPTRSDAAPVSVIVPLQRHDKLTLIAGRATLFEIPVEGRWYTDLPLLEEVRAICLAVMNGRLEEWLVSVGDDVVKGKGTIQLAEPLTIHWRRSLRPLRKSVKAYCRYQPWASAGDRNASTD